MNTYLVFGVVFMGAILAGVLLSLIVLLPPIRRAGSQDINIRRILISLFSVITFVVVFVGGTRLFAIVMVRTLSDIIDKDRSMAAPGSQQMEMIETWDRIKGDVLTELWLRQLTPDEGFPCRSGNLVVCEQMGLMGIFGTPNWGMYALYILTGLVSATASGFAVHTWTLQKKTE